MVGGKVQTELKMEKYKGLMIGGVDVQFPFKPYPSQLSMMSMIIKGLEQKKNCLLESPTGSGKTLSLLCAALAWQEKQKKIKRYLDSDKENDSVDSEKKFKVPKIWFGSRTHKQIAQVISELKTTAYKSVDMTILSSRQHSCINPTNTSSSVVNMNEGCVQLMKGTHPEDMGECCKYKTGANKVRTHNQLAGFGLDSAWDLEDLVLMGKRQIICPFYGSKSLVTTADIVFCPYNYLIDPMIRKSMMLTLRDQVVILDEAHNMEDSSRASASFTINEPVLATVVDDLNKMIDKDFRVCAMQSMFSMCNKIGAWLHDKQEELVEIEFETRSKVWCGGEFLHNIDEWGVTGETLPILKKRFQEAIESDDDDEFGDKNLEEASPFLAATSISFLEGVFFTLDNLLTMDKRFSEDYKVALIETKEFGTPKPKPNKNGWVSIHKRPIKRTVLNLHFWCLNPAVAFSQLSNTRCIILTSGTLSPMSSFASELGVSFPITLEAPHVIPNSQVWVGSIGCGPNKTELQATYQNVNGFSFQDELGSLVKSVCDVTPKGVLCFFTSYRLMEKMIERWQNTGMWMKISENKQVFSECHGRNAASQFDELLVQFYNATSSHGALLLAVFRGKVSEGLDFSNDNARAVITVGIPFPNIKDRQVSLKKRYNDNNTHRGLLSGSQWYDIQAYRALNQALGRCIRHKNDWGALIMVDKRFCVNPKKYCSGLSRWIRDKVNVHHDFDRSMSSLKEFCSNQQSINDSSSKTSTNVSEPVNKFSTPVKKISEPNKKFGELLRRCNERVKVDESSVECSESEKVESAYFNRGKQSRKRNNKSGSKTKNQMVTPKMNFFQKQFSAKIKAEIVECKNESPLKAHPSTKSVEIEQEKSASKTIVTPKINFFQKKITEEVKAEIVECKNESPLKVQPSTRSVEIKQEKTADLSPQIPTSPIATSDHDVTVIPESPNLVTYISDDDDDFEVSSATKRKLIRASAEPEAKVQKCKKMLSYDETQPKTRKKQKKKTANFHVCHHKVEKLKNCNIHFSYIEERFPDICSKLKTCECQGFVKQESDCKEFKFDCIWCDQDNLAYQFYNCSTCDQTVGFQVKNLPNFDNSQLIVFNSICSRS